MAAGLGVAWPAQVGLFVFYAAWLWIAVGHELGAGRWPRVWHRASRLRQRAFRRWPSLQARLRRVSWGMLAAHLSAPMVIWLYPLGGLDVLTGGGRLGSWGVRGVGLTALSLLHVTEPLADL